MPKATAQSKLRSLVEQRLLNKRSEAIRKELAPEADTFRKALAGGVTKANLLSDILAAWPEFKDDKKLVEQTLDDLVKADAPKKPQVAKLGERPAAKKILGSSELKAHRGTLVAILDSMTDVHAESRADAFKAELGKHELPQLVVDAALKNAPELLGIATAAK